MVSLKTCVAPEGRFRYGVHEPAFAVRNLREKDCRMPMGAFDDGSTHANEKNFPPGDVKEEKADTIFEIPNPLPFRGTTYIAKSWADEKAANLSHIRLPEPSPFSFQEVMREAGLSGGAWKNLMAHLPEPLLITIAATSTDPSDLMALAHLCCDFVIDPETGAVRGLFYEKKGAGQVRPRIKNHVVFETIANNPHLPDLYKEVMVLRPGVQGESEIVGEYEKGGAHIFEYLRRNSYIPWGHYAANMAHDAVRYRINQLKREDMAGLRHLYYQRTFVRLAQDLGLPLPEERKPLTTVLLESLRRAIVKQIHGSADPHPLHFNASLWGWNFGFDFAPTGYRLHASHQQIHQQFALIPLSVTSRTTGGGAALDPAFRPYGCGDMVADFIAAYRRETGHDFFDDYERAIRTNTRMDGDPSREKSLIVHEDDHVMVFVPKAQTSQWELNILTKKSVGNILEADQATRRSLDEAIFITMNALTSLGARMITCIEYPKRFDAKEPDQRLLYAFLPRLPESPGAFSEAQLRWINGHYPEDFAQVCREQISLIVSSRGIGCRIGLGE